MDKITVNLNQDDFKKSLRIMLSESGLDSFAALGRELGYKETTFRSSLNNKSIRLKDFINAADLMGFEVIVRKKQ
jgi:hypothetical protein